MAEQSGKRSSPAAIALAWLIVVVPTAWGLTHTVQSAMKIFTAAPAAETKPASAAPAP